MTWTCRSWFGFITATVWWLTRIDDVYKTHPHKTTSFNVVCHLSWSCKDVGHSTLSATVLWIALHCSNVKQGTFSWQVRYCIFMHLCISFSTLDAFPGKKTPVSYSNFERRTILEHFQRRGRLCFDGIIAPKDPTRSLYRPCAFDLGISCLPLHACIHIYIYLQ